MLSKDEMEKFLKELEEMDVCVVDDNLEQSEEWLSLVGIRGCYSSSCCGTQRMS